MGSHSVESATATGCDFSGEYGGGTESDSRSRETEGARYPAQVSLEPLYQFDRAGFVPHNLESA
jgi:hypothetical protein